MDDALLEADHASLLFTAPTDRKGSLKKWVLDAVRGRVGNRRFLAVDNVSFRIRRGEAVGLVGRNGAGKSTLLKLVTGIVEPTSGSIAVRGQVAPLLALGNGLDPALTGRENIYLNGAILGYEKAYLREKEADIVAFSELGDFIDAPVRTYSSGMTMRLAFSIATAASPEILILDEVLAVGDAAFQAKCRARIGEIIEDGATVFFVSHSLADVRELCTRVLWLDKGRLVADGPVAEVCAAFEDYSAFPVLSAADYLSSRRTDGTVEVARFVSLRNGGHFLTSSRREMGKTAAAVAYWRYDGPVFRVFSAAGPGTVPLFRFWSKKGGGHAFAAGEKQAAPFRAAPADWTVESAGCHVPAAAGPGMVPVHRLRRAGAPGFLFAVGDAERDAILAADPSAAVEGEPFFAFPLDGPSRGG